MTRQKTAAAGQREGRETKEAYFGFPAFCMKGVIRHCVIHAVHSGKWGGQTQPSSQVSRKLASS
ncbi:Uncharacterised protein [Hungatella hathewayi]|uniref:Uncharacterized protein n=1 Tax=Hungatella hathewayi TaxID=154046 RepID=A0A6N3DMX4_9FIRM|nr:hypothetical protein HMPREF1093_00723 [Hungatella hathewayi 12489931]